MLFLVRLVFVSLPVFHSTSLTRSNAVDVFGLFSGVVSFLVALAIVNYSFHVDAALKMMSPRFPAVGTLLRLIISAGATTYAFFALRDPLQPFIQGFETAYATVFAAILGLILLLVVALVYRNNEALADALMSICLRRETDQARMVQDRGQPSESRTICPECRSTMASGTKFCRKCGTILQTRKEGEASEGQ